LRGNFLVRISVHYEASIDADIVSDGGQILEYLMKKISRKALAC
jgi:hypothetical protein